MGLQIKMKVVLILFNFILIILSVLVQESVGSLQENVILQTEVASNDPVRTLQEIPVDTDAERKAAKKNKKKLKKSKKQAKALKKCKNKKKKAKKSAKCDKLL